MVWVIHVLFASLYQVCRQTLSQLFFKVFLCLLIFFLLHCLGLQFFYFLFGHRFLHRSHTPLGGRFLFSDFQTCLQFL